ncbi:DNA polymerase domain-containing protein, partial [Methanoculleus sp.]|uniref:DNA polymerase domain-containing protein n=1 Tax=Methanoculleus sp. TaxID=90427 RepID=UPI0025F4E172
GIGETKFAWFFYVLAEDYERLRSKFNQFTNNNVINSVEQDGKYVKIYADYPHKTESLNKEMERDWGYKTFAFNDMLEKLKMLECETFEADIPPHKRFALQDNVEFEQDYKCLFFDIETDDRIKNGQPIPGEFRILSVAFKDLVDGKEAFLKIAEDTDEEEKELLIKMGKIFNAYDVIISWNGISFDLPYVKSRMMRYGIQLDWRKVFHQDQMKVFQKSVSLRSYSLENVSQEYLGEGKVQHEGIGVYEMWSNHPELLEKYNRGDVRRQYELEMKTKYLAVARNVNAIGMCPCDDLFITRKVDNLIVKQAQEDKHYHFKTIIREYDENGQLIHDDDDDDDKFEGAYVFPPKPGRYKNVKVFDYSSLYPNVIKTLNISPDTLVTDDSVPDEMCIKTPSGHRFRKDFVGILPKVITRMKEKRDFYKDLMSKESPGSLMHKTYDNLQYVYKSFGLSFYGALGESHTRFYDTRIAESVTLGGQYFNKAGAKFLEDEGYIIIYGDSVTKDRCTIIKTGDVVSVISFEELFNKTTKRYIKDGKEYGSFDENVTALSYNFQTHDSEWKPIDCVVRHKVKKEVYHYRYRHGVTEVSKDHSLINSEGQCFKPTDGFNAFSLTQLPDIQPITTIDLLGYMEPYSYTRKRGGDVYLTTDGEKIFLSHNRVKKTTMLRHINVNDPMFNGFLSLIAHYICNGSSSTPETTQSRKGASIASRDFWLLNQLKQTTDWLFKNAENGLLCQPDGNNKLQMMTCLQAVVFKQLCGQKYDQKRIPDFVYRLSLEQKKHFIQQLMIGDGSITEIKSGTNYDFESASIKLISGLSTLMKQVGMTVVCQSNFNKKTYTVKNLINEGYGKHLIENICKPIYYDDYLYDLSVSDNHNFVDAMGSIILHNTDSLFVDKIKS